MKTRFPQLVYLLLLVASGLAAQGTWSTATLSEPRFYGAATTVGNKVIFAGGASSEAGNSDAVDIYDNATNSWSTATLSLARVYLAATSVGTKALFAGGRTSSQDETNVVDIYDDATGNWTTASLSQPAIQISATSAGGKAFFGGGLIFSTSSPSSVVDVYDNSTNSWSTETLPHPRYALAATAHGSKVFFGGGYNNGSSNVVDIYDIDTDSWTTAYLSTAREYLTAATVGDKVFFAGGGFFAASNVVDIYNTTTDTWSTATLSQARSYLYSTTLGSKVFFAGGKGASGDFLSVVDVYDYSTDSWSTASLSQPSQRGSAASVGTKAFFGLGFTTGGASSATNVVDIYSFPNGGQSCDSAEPAVEGTNYLPATANEEYWYSFTMPSDPNKKVVITSSANETVYLHGSTCESLYSFDNGYQGLVNTTLAANDQFFISFTTANGGDFSWNLAIVDMVTGDNCNMAEPVVEGTNHVPATSGDYYWYKFTMPSSGNKKIIVTSSSAQYVALSTACGSGVEDSGYENVAWPGFLPNQEVYIRWFLTSGGNFDWNFEIVDLENGDDCSIAVDAVEGTNTIPPSYGGFYWFKYPFPVGNDKKLVITSTSNNFRDILSGSCENLSGNLTTWGNATVRGPFVDQQVYFKWDASEDGISWDLAVEDLEVGESCEQAFTAIEGSNDLTVSNGNDYWYSFIVPGTGYKKLTASTSNEAAASIYTGGCNDLSMEKIGYKTTTAPAIAAGQQVFIKWETLFNGNLSWELSLEDIEPGEACQTAQPAVLGTNTAAHAPFWYKYTAPFDAHVTISSVGLTSVDTYIEVYYACNGGPSFPVDDFEGAQSQTTLTVSSGTELFIKWRDDHSSEGFDFDISVEEALPGTGCMLAAAAVIGENNMPGAEADSWYWYKFNAPNESGKKIKVSTESSNLLALYSGTCLNLSYIGYGYYEFFTSDFSPGEPLYFRWTTFDGQPFIWNLIVEDIVPGDDCSHADLATIGSNQLPATSNNDYWYSYTMPGGDTKKLVVSSDTDHFIAFYTSECQSSDYDGTSGYRLAKTTNFGPNETVLIKWSNFNGGDFSWDISLEDIVPGDNCFSALNASEGDNTLPEATGYFWYKFTVPDIEGKVLAVSSTTMEVINLYNGTCGNLTLVSSGEGRASTNSITPLQEIYIRWSLHNGGDFPFEITLADPGPEACERAVEAALGANYVPPTPFGEYWYTFLMPDQPNKKIIISSSTSEYIWVPTGQCGEFNPNYSSGMGKLVITDYEPNQQGFIRWNTNGGGDFSWNLSVEDYPGAGDNCQLATPAIEGENYLPPMIDEYWYSFTTPDVEGKQLVITSDGLDQVNIFSGNCDEYYLLGWGWKSAKTVVPSNTTILLRWFDQGSKGNFTWNLAFESIGSGDDCSMAEEAVIGTNNVPTTGGFYWYKFTMPEAENKKVLISTEADVDVYVFSGSCEELNELLRNDKTVSIAGLSAGEEIYIRWDLTWSNGNFPWQLSLEDVQSGDICAQAVTATEGLNVLPSITGFYWYTFTMPEGTPKKVILTQGDNIWFYVDVFTGSCDALSPHSGSANSSLFTDLAPGATVFVRWHPGDFSIHPWTLSIEDLELGDVCSMAIDATLGTNSTTGTPQWFTYTMPENGDLVISSSGTENFSLLKIYDVCGGNLLNSNYGWNGNPNRIEFNDLTAGSELLMEWADVNVPGGFDWSIKISQDITFDPLANKAYGDSDFDISGTASSSSGLSVTYSVASGPASLDGTVLTITGAGEVVIEATQLGDDSYLSAEPVQQTFTVAPKTITASGVLVSNKVYDGTTTATVTGGSLTGVLSADDGNVSLGTASFDNKNVGTDKPVSGFSLSGSKAGNYTLSQPTGLTANITTLAITVTAKPDQNKVYGEDDPTFKYTVSPSLASGDSFTGELSRASGENVKTYGINEGTLAAGDNYDMTFEGDDFIITQKEIEVVGLTVADKVYDGTTTATLGTAYTLEGILTTDDGKVTINTTSGSITFNSANVGNEIAVTIVDLELTGTSAQNYSLVQPEGLKGNILPKPITATGVVVANKVYDGTTEASVTAGTLSGVITADAGKVSIGATATFVDKNVATGKSISNFSITGTAAPNYSLIQPTGIKANITARPITVTADAGQNKQFGKADPEFRYTVSASLLTGDELTGSLARTAGESVGTYPMNMGTLANGNYAITFVSNDFEIRKANATISLTGIKTFTYDGLAKSFGVATIPAGVGVVVTYNGLTTAPIDAGSYAVVASIVDDSYQGSNATATLTIAKANQSITFGVIADRKVNDPAFALGATATSGLTVTYEATPDNRVTITNGQATIRGAGRVTITAIQAGDNNFNTAESVVRSFCINPPRPVVSSSQANPEAPVLTSDSDTGNQWFKNGNPMPEESNAKFTAHGPGVYTLKVRVDDCVSEASAPVSLITTGDITTPLSGSGFSVYPNPFIREIRILWNNPNATQEREVTLYDMMGHKIESKAGNAQEFIFDASGLSGGSYLVKGTEGNRTHFERIIKH